MLECTTRICAHSRNRITNDGDSVANGKWREERGPKMVREEEHRGREIEDVYSVFDFNLRF